MARLAPILANAYPGGAAWLENRLLDVGSGDARARVVIADGALGGIAIETPKVDGQMKLSTVWLAPELRNKGMGSELLGACIADWRAEGISRAWITSCATTLPAIEALVAQHGFTFTAREVDRYGAGRDEWVFHWLPDGQRRSKSRATTLTS